MSSRKSNSAFPIGKWKLKELSSDKSPDQSQQPDHPKVNISIIADHQTKTTVRIPPPDYPIQIFENDKPLPSGIKFKIRPDDKDEKTKETDSQGAIKIYKPKSKLELTLTTEIDSLPPEKEQRRATSDEDVLTPVQVK